MEVTILGGIVITPLIKAKASLELALDAPKSDLTRDACIQRFEYTFELAWKALKRILKHKGMLANNPRDVIRESAKQGLIDDPNLWFGFLDDRNQTTHAYNESVANAIYNDLPQFRQALDELLPKMTSL
jgi:nucleotidyltransferase substrate binding protein (TIGR01987 family)